MKPDVRRTLLYAMIAVVVMVLVPLVIVPVPTVYSPAFLIFIALLLVVAPVVAWLAVTRLPAPAPGRMPLSLRIGIALLALAYCSAASSILWRPPSPITLSPGPTLPAPFAGPKRTLRFARLPAPIASQFAEAFPAYAVGRALHSSSGAYEVWLQKPGSSSYALEALWLAGRISLENLQYNSLYAPQSGPPLSALAARVVLTKGRFYGPVRFPGYLLYVSLPSDQYYLVSRATGGVPMEAQGAW